MKTTKLIGIGLALWLGATASAFAQGTTAFTYQGQLQDGATTLNGLYDFSFTVWNAVSGPSQVGPTVTPVAVPVSNGLFTVTLDFGSSVFDGGARWLAIEVKTNLAPTYTPLTPRQRLTPAPYSLYAGTAGTAIPADNSVTSIKIVDGQVMTVDLANNAVTSTKILDGTILSPDLADGSVTTSKIADVNVTTAKLADGAVTSVKIADNTITSSDLASDAASLAKVAANRLVNSGDNVLVQGSGSPINPGTLFTGMGFQYQTSTGEGAIMSAYDSLAAGQGFLSFYTKRTGQPITQRMVIDYAGNVGINKPNPGTALDVNGTVTATGFVGPGLGLTGVVPADNSVTSAKIVDGQVQNADLANNSVTSGKILDGTILGADLAPGSVDTLNLANNSVTSAKIADASILSLDIGAGQLVKSLNGLRDDLTLAPGDNVTITPAGGVLTFASPTDWHLLGNGGTTAGTHFLGTTDNQPLWLKVQNSVGWRLVPSVADVTQPNVLGGAIGNSMSVNAKGTAIGGGVSNSAPTAIWYGFLGGGFGNSLSFSGTYADYAVLGGGYSNITWGTYSFLGGGMRNTNSGDYSAIPGGYQNLAAGNYSFAAGRQAKAANLGAFVWADSQAADFSSTAANQFLIRAAGNVGINKNNPGTALDVNGTVTATGFVGPGLGLTGVTPADNSVTSAKIVDGTIATADLANNSVTSAKILDGTILNVDLADNSVNAAKIVDGSVGTLELADNSVTSIKIANDNVFAVDLASDIASLNKVSGGRMAVSGNRAILNSLGPINTTLFTGLGFQYYLGSGEGAITASYDDGVGFLSFYTKNGPGQPITRRMTIAEDGNVGIGENNPAYPLNFAPTLGDKISLWGTGANTYGLGIQGGLLQIHSDIVSSDIAFGYGSSAVFTERMRVKGNGNVGIGTASPSAKLHVAGTAGTDGIKFPDGTLQTTAPFPQMSAGGVQSPATTNRFLGPTVTVTVSSSSQRILVSANSAMGTTVGAGNLRLYPGYRVSGSTAAPNSVGGGMFGIAVTANVRVPLGITGVITSLAPGTYEVGMVGYCPAQADANNWNNNEWGYVTATLY